ncbi:hypothetical protein RHSIM_Rhsim09G0166300 [Rhododendron simsii]|uniref:RRM domain-containing protein n=1 Tax=Rhododendron simsii TaxID=118357 RepID=A0A834GF34_RHOSS|nr:hypothetical protein RHSIM_Rhsim09G0166300 [Rhododendron simsii]
MRRYSPPYHSPPRRGYEGRARSPPGPPRRGGSGYGRNREQTPGSLLVRNIPLSCRPEELRVPFERFGVVRDVYLPKDYHTGEPRGFAFVQFVDSYDAAEAQYHMNGQVFAGREISVVVAAETRKRPEEMRRRTGPRGSSSRHGGRRSHYGRSRSRSISRSRSPPYPSGSRGRHHSRSFSPAPRRRADYSISPNGRHADHPRSSREDPKERDSGHIRRSDSYRNNPDQSRNGNRYDEKAAYESDEARPRRRSSPGRASRSPSGSRSRYASCGLRTGTGT